MSTSRPQRSTAVGTNDLSPGEVVSLEEYLMRPTDLVAQLEIGEHVDANLKRRLESLDRIKINVAFDAAARYLFGFSLGLPGDAASAVRLAKMTMLDKTPLVAEPTSGIEWVGCCKPDFFEIEEDSVFDRLEMRGAFDVLGVEVVYRNGNQSRSAVETVLGSLRQLSVGSHRSCGMHSVGKRSASALAELEALALRSVLRYNFLPVGLGSKSPHAIISSATLPPVPPAGEIDLAFGT